MKYTLNGKLGAITVKVVVLILPMPYAFPDAPQSIAIAQTCLFEYEIGKETVAGVTEFSRDNPHCVYEREECHIRMREGEIFTEKVKFKNPAFQLKKGR